MHKSDALADDGQLLDCPRARWQHIDKDRHDYGMPGFDACASVERDSRTDYYAWSYFVSCAVQHSELQGRYNEPNTCFAEVRRWLRDFSCPGEVAKQDKPWKQWTMIGR
jgi:hypothetical protein